MNRPKDVQISTHGTRMRARLDMRHPCNTSFGYKTPNLPEEIRDRIAEQDWEAKTYGGYNVRKSNRCDKCFQCRSTNGSCGCDA